MMTSQSVPQQDNEVVTSHSLVTTSTLQKTKQAIADITDKLEPVLKKLKTNDFGDDTPQAQATVALSIGMMRYMGARLQGLDQGRSKDDPLRQELNKMKAVLAEIKKRRGSVKDDTQMSSIPTDNGNRTRPSLKGAAAAPLTQKHAQNPTLKKSKIVRRY
ncbi:hypothetical protein IV203_024252 [Nitzschia inconspicua]|uniref:Uncharacterized protein n=1 Tax=Nitzschia inconspicua TaxID=303405 RepID=A0A9K3PD45_9STRA|nr:hypothetical protein IV203_024252 [Nitzschia inconspicua]